jgi:hypothetical protein
VNGIDKTAVEQPSGETAPQNNGAAGLDDLLAEFEQSTQRSDTTPTPSPQGIVTAATDLEDIVTADQSTLDDIVDPNSRYWRDRHQTALLHRTKEQVDQRINEFKAYEQKIIQLKNEAEDAALIRELRGELNVTDKDVKDFLTIQVRDNSEFLRIYNEREQNPRVYEALKKQLGRDFLKSVNSRPDPTLTEDREAVAAAVRGASINRAPESPAPNYSHMSNNEFRQSIRDQFGFDPGT